MPAAPRTRITFNQQQVLFDVISKVVRAHAPKSMLDIGAGDGALGLRLSGLVDRYRAVEMDPTCCIKMRSRGLQPIEARFPVDIDGEFDLVLSSHSIPEESYDFYPPFLESAWDLISENGKFLIITFKGSTNPPIRQLIDPEMKQASNPDERYVEMIDHLCSMGTVNVHEVASHVTSTDASVLLDAFKRWFDPEEYQQADYRELLVQRLRDRFVSASGFSIPMTHQVIEVNR